MDAGYDVFEYSRRGMVRELREALEGGSKPDTYMGYDGGTALVVAARQGHGAVVKLLLEHGASTAVRTEEGSTMMHHAVSGGSPQAVNAMLDAGVNVDECNEDGVSPLLLAADQGLYAIVKLLCERGADVTHEAEGWGTALDCATGEIASYLENRGAKRSENGADQPLASAAERFNYGCFDTGENPNIVPVKAPKQQTKAAAASGRPKVGDYVKLRRAKAGLLKEGDVGNVVEDDGSDCLPLKVKFGDGHDYYDTCDIVVCKAPVELGPDGDRATVEGTERFLSEKLNEDSVSTLGTTGLSVSPVGFGCHRLEEAADQKAALQLAIAMGCNFVDLAPNYTDGVAEEVAGQALNELISGKKVRRDELIIATKVGNVLGKQLTHAFGVKDMAKVNDKLFHCISPEWIEQELTRSLSRLQLSCVDCLLLHCPEYECKAEGVDMEEVYKRLGAAFQHLEKEVEKGRIAMYGVSAAFNPLRPTDPEHLVLDKVMAQLPEGHHFRVLQFPLNYAECQPLWIGHCERKADGTAVDGNAAMEAPTLFEAARKYGLATLINRPLDGIWKESHGVLRFSSLDCDVRSFSELQLDNCDQLESKLTNLAQLHRPPFGAGEGASGQLASKTVKTLAGLKDVDCVLLGMRRPEYVLDTLPLAFGTPPVAGEVALAAVRALNNTVAMWFATAIHEADHGTAKDWRLPMKEKYTEDTEDKALGA